MRNDSKGLKGCPWTPEILI